MCGRYALYTRLDRLIEQFDLFRAANIQPRYNIAPFQQVPVIRPGDQGRELVLLRWGLIPHWAKDAKTGYSMINARAETVAEKPAFRNAFRHRRCLIQADGFYEWKKLAPSKQPYYLQLGARGPFAFAGLWEYWQGPKGEAIESCAIIVTDANDLMRPIHDRMPVILDPKNYLISNERQLGESIAWVEVWFLRRQGGARLGSERLPSCIPLVRVLEVLFYPIMADDCC